MLLLIIIIIIIIINTTVSSIYQRAPAVIRGPGPAVQAASQRVGGARRACHRPACVALLQDSFATHSESARDGRRCAGDGGHLWLARRRAYFPRVWQGN